MNEIDEIIPVVSEPPKINNEIINIKKVFRRGLIIGIVLSLSGSAIIDYIIEKDTLLRKIFTSWRYLSINIWIAIFVLFTLFFLLIQYQISNKLRNSK